MMERIAKKLTAYIIGKGIVAESEEKIYFYGFQMGLELIFNLSVSILIAIKMDMLPQAAIFFIVFIPIRSYAGGFHFEKYLHCFILSVVTYVGVLELSQILTIAGEIHVVADVVFLILVWYFFPVQNIHRMIDEDEKRYFSKKLQQILVADFVLIIVLLVLKKEDLLAVVSLTLVLIVVSMIAGKIKYYIWQKRQTSDGYIGSNEME